MVQQVFYEDVKEGMEIPQLVVNCNLISQAKWASVNKDYAQYHLDREYARSIKLPDAIVNGRFKVILLFKMLADWVGDGGTVRKLSCQHRGMDIVGDPVTFKGVVIKCIEMGDEHCIECEVWTENPKGERTIRGTAIVALPLRS